MSVPRGSSSNIRPKLLGVICACVLVGILTAGLWPFHAPQNDVSWLSGGRGLLFGKYGSIVSASPFKPQVSQRNNSCSLEIWLEPTRVDSGGMILGFYWPESRVVRFALRQFRNGLVLEPESKRHYPRSAEIYVGDVFSGLKPAFVTITSSGAGTFTYVDGTLVKRSPNFTISSRNLTGQFVVGNSPIIHYNWSGLVKGLAIYDRELSPSEVSRSFENWTSGGQNSATSEGIVARYLFDEGKGSVAHNQVDSATYLSIPERYFVLHPQFLERPWDEFHPGWSYWKDLAINVVGFVPLGFFLYAYFSQVRKAEHSVAVTIGLGFAVSLTIEVLQAFLPTRNSGMTDLFTNTLGTAVGVVAFRHKAVQAAMAAAGFDTEKAKVRPS